MRIVIIDFGCLILLIYLIAIRSTIPLILMSVSIWKRVLDVSIRSVWKIVQIVILAQIVLDVRIVSIVMV